MTEQIIRAFILGLIGGAVPGTVLIATFTEILRCGLFKSFRVIFWAMLVETIIAFGIVLWVAFLSPPLSIFYGLSMIGGLYIVYLAWQVSKIRALTSKEEILFTPSKIIMATVLNGSFWIFWITICVPLAFELNRSIHVVGYPLFVSLFEIGWLVSTSLLAFIFSRFRNILLNTKNIHIVFMIMAALLVYMGLQLLYAGIVYFFL